MKVTATVADRWSPSAASVSTNLVSWTFRGKLPFTSCLFCWRQNVCALCAYIALNSCKLHWKAVDPPCLIQTKQYYVLLQGMDINTQELRTFMIAHVHPWGVRHLFPRTMIRARVANICLLSIVKCSSCIMCMLPVICSFCIWKHSAHTLKIN